MKQMKKYTNTSIKKPDGNIMNMYLINMEVKHGAIDTDDSSCHSYYILKFSSSL